MAASRFLFQNFNLAFRGWNVISNFIPVPLSAALIIGSALTSRMDRSFSAFRYLRFASYVIVRNSSRAGYRRLVMIKRKARTTSSLKRKAIVLAPIHSWPQPNLMKNGNGVSRNRSYPCNLNLHPWGLWYVH